MTLPQADVVIAGSRGAMGAMLLRRISATGRRMLGIDREEDKNGELALSATELARLIPQGRIVMLCVPVTALPGVLASVTPHMRSGQILMDITSVKILPMRQMQEAWGGPVIGSHPLFGPNPDPADMRVPLTPGENAAEEHIALVEKLFRDMGCETFRTTAEEHDRGVGFAQSLNFTLSAAFFALLARQEASLPHGVRPFLTPSFKRHMEAARKHLTQDTAMFCEFTASNPRFTEVLEAYRDMLREAGTGREALAKIAAEAAIWYEG